MTDIPVVMETHLPGLKLWRRGKVRDVYAFGDELLFIATDRVSVFDVVLPTGIPQKGAILTQLSAYWFRHFDGLVRHHMRTADFHEFPDALRGERAQLAGRSMLVRKTEPLPVECVVRGYLAGSGWREYQRTQSVCGVRLPAGLVESAQLPEPIFTPATKAESGHDENISFTEMRTRLGDADLAARLRDLSLEIYRRAADHVAGNGLILCDTKFEFGLDGDEIVWIDEVLTPDSSRYWLRAEYAPGKPQVNFDKQSIRDYTESLGWDKTPPGPELPAEVVEACQRQYLQAYEQITGEPFARTEAALRA